MKPISRNPGRRPPQVFAAVLLAATLALVMTTNTHAGPGAHGPNGEHLDAPATGSMPGATSPRVEAKSELFELVGHLEGGALTLLIDKFATNEPVLSASVDVEAGATRAKAVFRAEQGDYVVTDPAMLKLLAGPTKQAMVFTIAAGADTDLLDGALTPASVGAGHDDAHDHGIGTGKIVAGAALVLVALFAAFLYWRVRRQRRSPYASTGAGK